MKIYVNGQFIDPNENPVFIVFENDEDRKNVAGHLSNMEEKEGIRMYATYDPKVISPDEVVKTFDHILEIMK